MGSEAVSYNVLVGRNPKAAHLMIYIVGIHHELQYWDGSDSPFLAAFRDWNYTLKLSVFAEELNQEEIEKQQQFLGRTLASTAQQAASLLGLEHRFCDPNTFERAALGILATKDLRKKLGLRAGENEDFLQKEERRLYWPLREKFWLERIRDKSEEEILFICGACHVESFLSLVESSGLKATVIHKDWVIEKPFMV